MTSLQLNSQQQQALDSILSFLNSDLDCFILKGSAGTGKTTLIGHLVRELNKMHRECTLVAPTGRAARIIYMKTGKRASTLHGAIYSMKDLTVNEEATNPGKPGYADANDPCHHFSFPLLAGDPGNVLFIVDESSMVGDLENKTDVIRFGSGKLLSDLVEYTRIGRHGRPSGQGAKILFIGDPAQLPPVGQSLSPAMALEYLKQEFGIDAEEFELTEVMRQAEGGEILAAATRLRNAIVGKEFNRFSLKSDGDEIHALSVSKGVDVVTDSFRSNTPAAFVTYTNEQALQFNRSVRQKLFGDERLPVQKAEILLVNKNCGRCQLFNGDLVKVISREAIPEVKHIAMKGVPEPVRLSFRRAEIAFRNALGDILTSQCLLLENLLESKDRELSAAERRALLVDFRTRNPDLKPQTSLFNETLRDDEYFNALQVKYGYALTCHKAQGGEWETVVVNFSGSRGTRNEEYFRWAYTAITRAKKCLLTISAPEFNEISEMDWGSITPQPVQASGQALPRESAPGSEDPDWLRFSFAAGQEKLFGYFQKIKEALDPMKAEIVDIEHCQYMERYFFAREGKRATVQFYYKGDRSLSKVSKHVQPGDDDALCVELTRVIEDALLDPTGKKEGVRDAFILQFHKNLDEKISGTGISIVGAESLPYRYRVEFEHNGDRSKIDFCYNGKQKWTSVSEVKGPGSSQGLKEKLHQLLKG